MLTTAKTLYNMNFITPLICELLTYLDDCLFSFSPVCLSNSQDAHSYLIGMSFASFFVCCTILSHTNGALTKTHSETLSYSLSLTLPVSHTLSLSYSPLSSSPILRQPTGQQKISTFFLTVGTWVKNGI